MKRATWWRRAVGQALVLVALSVTAAVATHFLHPMAPAWYLVEAPLKDDEVTLERVNGEFAGQVLWLDARPEEQFNAGHIPGARLLNEQGFDGQLFELIEGLQTNLLPVVIYCGGEKCEASRKVKERLLSSFPLENVWVLKGGWKAWEAAGGEVAKGSAGEGL
jgi:3-mercaptopyruvate sulfurtransferase SseA